MGRSGANIFCPSMPTKKNNEIRSSEGRNAGRYQQKQVQSTSQQVTSVRQLQRRRARRTTFRSSSYGAVIVCHSHFSDCLSDVVRNSAPAIHKPATFGRKTAHGRRGHLRDGWNTHVERSQLNERMNGERDRRWSTREKGETPSNDDRQAIATKIMGLELAYMYLPEKT